MYLMSGEARGGTRPCPALRLLARSRLLLLLLLPVSPPLRLPWRLLALRRETKEEARGFAHERKLLAKAKSACPTQQNDHRRVFATISCQRLHLLLLLLLASAQTRQS